MMADLMRHPRRVAVALGAALLLSILVYLRTAAVPPNCATFGVVDPPDPMGGTPQEALIAWGQRAAESSALSRGREAVRWQAHAASASAAQAVAISEGRATGTVPSTDAAAPAAQFELVKLEGGWGVESFTITMPADFCSASTAADS